MYGARTMKHCYERHEFRGEASGLINHADAIMSEYAADGYDLTLRQLYYQFVARGLLENNEKNYKRLGDVVNKGRLAGHLDWETMVDRTREVRMVSHWASPSDIISSCSQQFCLDTRSDQDKYIEVWVEKEALAGVVVPVCRELDVHSLVCRGFVSQSAMWQAAQRFASHDLQSGILFYLGDHDPSGIDMTRDIEDRLNDTFGGCVIVVRIALTMEQVEQFRPPPNPAKVTDSRYAAYVKKYGEECWEMDALDPRTLTGVIETAVTGVTDQTKRRRKLKAQDKAKATLSAIAKKLSSDPKWKP